MIRFTISFSWSADSEWNTCLDWVQWCTGALTIIMLQQDSVAAPRSATNHHRHMLGSLQLESGVVETVCAAWLSPSDACSGASRRREQGSRDTGAEHHKEINVCLDWHRHASARKHATHNQLSLAQHLDSPGPRRWYSSHWSRVRPIWHCQGSRRNVSSHDNVNKIIRSKIRVEGKKLRIWKLITRLGCSKSLCFSV